MTNQLITNNSEYNNQTINRIDKVDDYLFVRLNNGSCFLTDGSKYVKIASDINIIKKVFKINNTLYAYVNDTQVINLETNEVLLNDSRIAGVFLEDEDSLNVIRYGMPTTLYSFKTNDYLPVPDNYEFERNLGNHLYSYCEKNSDKKFHELNRLIINSAGKVILDNINGHIQSYENNIIIKNDNEILIIKFNNGDYQQVKINKTDKVEYYYGNIFIIEKELIKILDLDLNVINSFTIPNLETVYDWEVTGGIIKLQLPFIYNGEDITKRLYINLANGKRLDHWRIHEIPYYTPKYYVCFDDLENYERQDNCYYKPGHLKTYIFYDQAFDKKAEVNGNCYEDLNNGKYIVYIKSEDEYNSTFVNINKNVIKKSPYENIHFENVMHAGYGFNQETDMIDIVDESLNILFKNIDYKAFNIKKEKPKITFRIVNNYLIFQIHYDYNEIRNIIFDQDSNIVFDTINHSCKPLGDLIEIKAFDNEDSIYLNTLTGKMGTLSITKNSNIPTLIMNNQEENVTILQLTEKG